MTWHAAQMRCSALFRTRLRDCCTKSRHEVWARSEGSRSSGSFVYVVIIDFPKREHRRAPDLAFRRHTVP